MALKRFIIDGFVGLDQSIDENRLPLSFSADAANIATDGGRLSLTKGFTKMIQDAAPDESKIRYFTYYRGNAAQYPVIIADNTVYAYKDVEWTKLHTIDGNLNTAKFDSAMVQIGDADCLVIADGINPLIKYDGTVVSLFGSEEGCSDMPISFIAMYRGRLFAAGYNAQPNRLYYSVLPGDGRTVDNWGYTDASPAVEGGHVEIGSSNGDSIVGIKALSNQLLIFKKNSLYRLIGDRPSNFTIEHIDASYRTTGQQRISAYGDVLFFLTENGLYYYNGVTARPASDIFKIKNLMQDALVNSSCLVTVGDKLYFNIKNMSEDMLIEYDLTEKKYLLRKGFRIAFMYEYRDHLLFSNNTGYIYQFGRGTTFDGEKINAYWTTPLTDLGDKGAVKALHKLYLRGTGDSIIIKTNVDDLIDTYKRKLPTSEHKILEVKLTNEGRTFQLTVLNNDGDDFELVGGLELIISERYLTE